MSINALRSKALTGPDEVLVPNNTPSYVFEVQQVMEPGLSDKYKSGVLGEHFPSDRSKGEFLIL